MARVKTCWLFRQVDQVLEEEKGERWEVLRQSLRAVLHRLVGVGGEGGLCIPNRIGERILGVIIYIHIYNHIYIYIIFIYMLICVLYPPILVNITDIHKTY